MERTLDGAKVGKVLLTIVGLLVCTVGRMVGSAVGSEVGSIDGDIVDGVKDDGK